MRVAGIQMDIAWEDPAANFETVRAADTGDARLVVLPEMFATGFTMNATKVAPLADSVREFLSERAKETGAYVLGGYAEEGSQRPRNACSIYDRSGAEILHYQKIHPFTLAGEEEHYDGGESLTTVTIEGVRVTPVICYDLRFPELFRIAAERTDLFVVIANWPAKRSHPWRTLLMARAAENQAYVLGVNRVGIGGGEPHSGDSLLVDPFGNPIDSASGEPAVVTGEVDPAKVADAREHFSFLADRRPDVYEKLREEG